MDDIARALERPDARFWIPVNGSTLAPLARRGDRARIRACDGAALRRGDLALLRREDTWSVRLVTGVRPLRTSSLRDAATDEPGAVRGRVDALERAGTTRRYGTAMRFRALLLHAVGRRVAALLRGARGRLGTTTVARAVRSSRVGGEARVRRLHEDDRAELARFAARSLPRLAAFVDRQLVGRWKMEGIAMGAFTGAGRLVGFAFLDEYREEEVDLPGRWVRGLAVAPEARRLGVGAALVRALCDEAAAAGMERVWADILSTNAASIRLFEGAGFRRAAPEVEALVNRELSPREGGRALVAVEREFPAELASGPVRRIALTGLPG